MLTSLLPSQGNHIYLIIPASGVNLLPKFQVLTWNPYSRTLISSMHPSLLFTWKLPEKVPSWLRHSLSVLININLAYILANSIICQYFRSLLNTQLFVKNYVPVSFRNIKEFIRCRLLLLLWLLNCDRKGQDKFVYMKWNTDLFFFHKHINNKTFCCQIRPVCLELTVYTASKIPQFLEVFRGCYSPFPRQAWSQSPGIIVVGYIEFGTTRYQNILVVRRHYL